MKRSTTYLGLLGSGVLALALGFGGTASVWADEPTKSSGKTDKEVQERAVPRQTPGVFVGSCQCYDGRGTCKEGSTKGTCVKGDFQPCSGTCKMTKPEGSIGGGGITIK